MTTQIKPPLAYYGGKTRLAGTIAAMLPAHEHYIEPFAGSCAVLLAKRPSRMETVNDLHGDLMCFWRVLRDDPAGLARVCHLTPHSRAEYAAACQADLTDLSDLEHARLVWIRLTQGRTGTLRSSTGWRHCLDGAATGTSMPHYLDGYLDRFAAVAERLHHVSLECRDAIEVIAAYGQKASSLLYVDPPYPASTGRSRNYAIEMSGDDDHRRLAEALRAADATAVVSGYPCELYDRELYRDWYRYTLDSFTTQGNGRSDRVEVLWSNRPLVEPEPVLDFEALAIRHSETAGAPAGDETRSVCELGDCAKVFDQPTRGRRRRYCSPACRTQAWRSKQSLTVQ
jgi:DNA adenine methylase